MLLFLPYRTLLGARLMVSHKTQGVKTHALGCSLFSLQISILLIKLRSKEYTVCDCVMRTRDPFDDVIKPHSVCVRVPDVRQGATSRRSIVLLRRGRHRRL